MASSFNKRKNIISSEYLHRLYSEILCNEQSETETKRIDLLNRTAKCTQQLAQSKERILVLLFESDGNILDDEALVDGLNETKEAIMTIKTRLAEHEEAESGILEIREKYRSVAQRATILFKNLLDLVRLNANYQFNLVYFLKMLRKVMVKDTDFPQRTKFLMDEMVFVLYDDVAVALHEHDRIAFQFTLAWVVEKSQGRAGDSDMRIFLECAKAFEANEGVRMILASVNKERMPDDFGNTIDSIRTLSINGIPFVSMPHRYAICIIERLKNDSLAGAPSKPRRQRDCHGQSGRICHKYTKIGRITHKHPKIGHHL